MKIELGRLRRPSKKTTTRLVLQCFDADACEVAFEPWGTVETLRVGDTFTVEVSGPGDGVVEVACRPGGISLWAWSGADVVAWDKEGKRLSI